MKKLLFIFIFIIMITGLFNIPVLFESLPIAYTQNVSSSQKTIVPQTNYVLSTIYTIFGFCGIWAFFYYYFYPKVLLQYFPPSFSQNIFWSMVLIYSFMWFSFSIYYHYGVGSSIPWIRYALGFPTVFCFMWFIAMLFTKNKHYE